MLDTGYQEKENYGGTESQKAREGQTNHESHEWTNITNYSCHLLICVIRDFPSFFSASQCFAFIIS